MYTETAGSTATDTTAVLDALRAGMAGELVLPTDAGWDAARTAWNLAVDQRPAAVALPVCDADVVAVVRAARAAGLRVAPQGTGHGALSRGGELADSILLSTARMRGVRIDAEARTARVRAGALWLDVTEPASAFGLAPLAGSSPDVGVVGYTLGGGLSWLGRKHGLASESLIAVELVTADGEHLRADRTHHADLFWALRGGGGAFGVVTAMEFRLYPAQDLSAGSLFFDGARAREVIRAWREWTVTAPDEVTTSLRILHVPPLPMFPEPMRGRTMVNIDAAVLGTPEAAAAILAPLTDLGPEICTLAPVEPVALSRLHGDPEQPVPNHGDGRNLAALTDEAIDTILTVAGAGSGTALMGIELRQLGGALARRQPGAGALGAIDAPYLLFMVGMAMSPEMGAAVVASTEALTAATTPWHAGTTVPNFAETIEAADDIWGDADAALLADVKASVDATDVFRSNHPVA
jgi:hypothetical protein